MYASCFNNQEKINFFLLNYEKTVCYVTQQFHSEVYTWKNWQQALEQTLVWSVHCSASHESQKVETAQVSADDWMSKMWSFHVMDQGSP